MQIIKRAGLLMGIAVMLSTSLYATNTGNLADYKVTGNTLYQDTSNVQLSYISIPGFLVCPLQVPGELLAPFSQAREGYSHEGIDIRAVEGTPIFAIADGTVTKAAPDSKGVENGGGHMIFVDFGNQVEGRYMHLSAYGVKAGDSVRAGQVIGFTGNTGDSTTPHLHFEYRINGVPIDPAFIFQASGMISGEAGSVAKLQSSSSTLIYNTDSAKESFYVLQQ